MLCLEPLPCRSSGNGLRRRKGVSWLSALGGKFGLSRPSGLSCPYSVETGLFFLKVARISSLSVGLRNAGCVSSRDRGLVMAECRCSLDAAGLRYAPCLSSRDDGRWDDGATANLSRFGPVLRTLGLFGLGTTWTLVKGLIGLGLGPCSARIWAFWMAMRSQETRPDLDGPGRGS